MSKILSKFLELSLILYFSIQGNLNLPSLKAANKSYGLCNQYFDIISPPKWSATGLLYFTFIANVVLYSPALNLRLLTFSESRLHIVCIYNNVLNLLIKNC